ncbi:sulfotransferase [Oricola sp.]|uniref:sulfotransferase n=1 Tax=Oricola sp. TaxID=1979950 RepID=UPI003BAD8270
MSEKIFVLGVGAQKAGTTWLYKYLNGFDDVNTGRLKEYHIWDAVDLDVFRDRRIGRWAYLRKKIRRKQDATVLRYEMQNRRGAYEAYFRSIVDQGYRVTGDITPSYALLPVQRLADLKSRLEAVGLTVKVVFSMRDPVERCWSEARMIRRMRNQRLTPELAALSEADHVRAEYSRFHSEQRTRYQRTVQRLDDVFDKDDIFYGFYESLFQAPSLERLGQFLGIPVAIEKTAEVVNQSPKTRGLDPELRREIAGFYRDTYEFCFDRFPETRELWNPV